MADLTIPRDGDLRFDTTSNDYTTAIVDPKVQKHSDHINKGDALPTEKIGIYRLFVADNGANKFSVSVKGTAASPQSVTKGPAQQSLLVTYEVT